MYPQSELTRLAAHKAALRRDIALRRTQCAAAATQLARPLAWLDPARAFARRLTPVAVLAALPLGWLVTRTVAARVKFLGALSLGAVRGLSSAFKTCFGPAKSPGRPG